MVSVDEHLIASPALRPLLNGKDRNSQRASYHALPQQNIPIVQCGPSEYRTIPLIHSIIMHNECLFAPFRSCLGNFDLD